MTNDDDGACNDADGDGNRRNACPPVHPFQFDKTPVNLRRSFSQGPKSSKILASKISLKLNTHVKLNGYCLVSTSHKSLATGTSTAK